MTTCKMKQVALPSREPSRSQSTRYQTHSKVAVDVPLALQHSTSQRKCGNLVWRKIDPLSQHMPHVLGTQAPAHGAARLAPVL